MIFDKMERLAQYKGMNANLDKLIDFVLNNSFDALQPGRNEIDGENCWLNNNVAPLQAQTISMSAIWITLICKFPLMMAKSLQ